MSTSLSQCRRESHRERSAQGESQRYELATTRKEGFRREKQTVDHFIVEEDLSSPYGAKAQEEKIDILIERAITNSKNFRNRRAASKGTYSGQRLGTFPQKGDFI